LINYLQNLHIAAGYLKRRHGSLLALQTTNEVQRNQTRAKRNKSQVLGSGGSGYTSAIPTLTSTRRREHRATDEDHITQCVNGPGRRRAGRAWSRRARPWRVKLPEASRRGQWSRLGVSSSGAATTYDNELFFWSR
jgi:hypothetical protein